jgi:hypothetical protein
MIKHQIKFQYLKILRFKKAALRWLTFSFSQQDWTLNLFFQVILTSRFSKLSTSILIDESDKESNGLFVKSRNTAQLSTAAKLRREICSNPDFFNRFVMVQKYESFAESGRSHGLGDFLLGSIRLAQECISLRKIMFLDFSSHPLINFLAQPLHPINRRPIYELDKDLDFSKIQRNVFFTHQRPIANRLLKPAIQIVRSQFLNPTREFSENMDMVFNNSGIVQHNYDAIHIRFSDKSESIDNRLAKEIRFSLQEMFSINEIRKSSYIILTNRIEFSNSLLFDGLNVKCNPIEYDHNSPSSSENDYLYTIEDFMILLNAKRIFQMSQYSWGSGFSLAAAHLGQIPLTNMNFPST